MRLNLKARVLSLAVLPVLLFALIISVSTVFMLREQAQREVDETRQHLLAEAKATLQSYVAVAVGTIKPLYDAAAPGDMQARADVIKMLSQVKYAKDGYFFGYDSQAVRLFKGDSPDGVGKSFKDARDPNGVFVNAGLSTSRKPARTTSNTHLRCPAPANWCPNSVTPSTCPSGTWPSALR